MAANAQLSTGGFAARTALFYGVTCILLGIHMPFFPVWLQARGFDAGMVGLMLSATALLRILSVPAATYAADRLFDIRGVMIVLAAATAVGFGALGLTHGVWPIVVLTLLTACAHTPTMALLDAYALRGLKAHGGAYGPVRLWGSAAFILANVGAGLAFDLIDAGDLIWLIAASALSIAVVSLLLPPLAPPRAAAERTAPPIPLWRDARFALVVLAASFVQASHAVYYGFSTIAWTVAGYDGISIGALWALGVIAEIVLFALSGRLPPALGALPLLLIGASGAVLRWTAMAFDPPGWTLPLLQLLHGLSFGASHLGAIAFVAQAAPEGRAATAQGYFSVTQGLALSGAMLVAGYLYARAGAASYAAMAAIALCGGVMTLAALRAQPRG